MENSANDASRNTQDSSSKKAVFRPNDKIVFPGGVSDALHPAQNTSFS